MRLLCILAFLEWGLLKAEVQVQEKKKKDACFGWQCQPTTEMKAKYGVRPGEKEFFCDIPIFNSKNIPKDVKENASWRFRPFILRKGSTLSKEFYSQKSLRAHAKRYNISASLAYSWSIVRRNGMTEAEHSLYDFLKKYMHENKYDGDTQMERPIMFHDQSPLFNFVEAQFTIPSLMRSWSETTTLKFYPGRNDAFLSIGASLSGTSFHWHSANLLVQAHGYKRWALYPPTMSPPGGGHGSWPVYDWFKNIYPALGDDSKPIECIQQPGDIIWIPELWYHSTVNLGDTVAVAIQVDGGETEAYKLRKKWTTSDSRETAIVHLEDLMKLLPENNGVKLDLAVEYLMSGRQAEADKLLREVIERDRFDPDAIVFLTDMLEKKINQTGTGLNELKETLSSSKEPLELNLRSYASNKLLARYFGLLGNQSKLKHYKQRLRFLKKMNITEEDLYAPFDRFTDEGSEQEDEEL